MLVISHNNIAITSRPIRNRTIRKVVYTFPVVPWKLYEQYLYSKALERKMNLPPAGFKQYDDMVFQLFRFSIRECLATYLSLVLMIGFSVVLLSHHPQFR